MVWLFKFFKYVMTFKISIKLFNNGIIFQFLSMGWLFKMGEMQKYARSLQRSGNSWLTSSEGEGDVKWVPSQGDFTLLVHLSSAFREMIKDDW